MSGGRTGWFTEARFGMFVHWSPLAAIDKEIGWSWGREVSAERYMELCRNFSPVNFDAEAWVLLAKRAGMRYLVFVPKHHDGFCLWDTKATDFNIMNTPFGRDVCKELSEACDKHGIAFCTYYSIADLHENGWSVMPWVASRDFEPVRGGMDAYFGFVKLQCSELIRNYGARNFWFDGFWHPEWYGNAAYRVALRDFIRSIDPDVIMSRLQMPTKPKGGQWDDGWDFATAIGDYHSREDHGGAEWEGLRYDGPWEFCSSVAYPNYSYNSRMKLKTSDECVRTLAKLAGRNGNYLLNMAPRPDGGIDPAEEKVFDGIGEWMSANGESIYGTSGGPFPPAGRAFSSTMKGKSIYLHLMRGQRRLSLPSIADKVVGARILGGDGEVSLEAKGGRMRLSLTRTRKDTAVRTVELVLDCPASELAASRPGLSAKR